MTINFDKSIDRLLTNLMKTRSNTILKVNLIKDILTAPFESDISLEISGTSLLNCIVDAPNLEKQIRSTFSHDFHAKETKREIEVIYNSLTY